MRSSTNLLLSSALIMSLAACAPMAATYQNDLNQESQKQGSLPADTKGELWCFDDKVDFELRTTISRFDMNGGTSVHAGFGGIPGIPFQALDLNFSYSTGQLDTSMSLFLPFRTSELTTQSGQGEKNDISFGLDFLAGWGGGFQNQSQTPIYDLSQNALTNNLNNLIAALPKLGLEAWSTNVIDVLPDENGFDIPVGVDGGIQKGDEFKIMSVTYDWAGTPCASELRMTRLKSTDPIAVAVAEEVRSDVTFLRLKATPKAPIEKFAYVTISKLVSTDKKKPRTTLGRSLRIGRVSSQPLTFKVDSSGQQQTIDLAPMVYQQLKLLLGQSTYSSSFYLRD